MSGDNVAVAENLLSCSQIAPKADIETHALLSIALPPQLQGFQWLVVP
jgi:hypothetical protein